MTGAVSARRSFMRPSLGLEKGEREKDRAGRPLDIPASTPFYCYIVCDVTPTLRKQAALAALTAWFSGREATGLGPVRAVKEDW